MRADEPYASVIVPTHNRASTLPYAVASIQTQTVRHLEIIIVGDGVDTPTRDAAHSLASRDSRIVFRDLPKAPRAGIVHRHNAVLQARSARIFYSDDDDLLQPHHVETLGPHLDTHDFVESLPASLSLSGHVEVALANHAWEPMRTCLADKRVKLTYDTHVAHRRDAYLSLGSPWLSDEGGLATAFLAAFARSPRIRWKSIPDVTALSLHGAARRWMSPAQREEEMVRALPLLKSSLLRVAHLGWYVRPMTDAPELLDVASLEAFLTRLGFGDWVSAGEPGTARNQRPTEDATRELERLVAALRGEAQDPASVAGLALRMCEALQGGPPHCDAVARLLMPTAAVVDIPRPAQSYAQEMSTYLQAVLALRCGNPRRALDLLDALPPSAVVHADYRLELLARAFLDDGRYGEAIACAETSIGNGNTSWSVQEILMKARIARGGWRGSLSTFRYRLSALRYAYSRDRH